jgi:predicted metal-dependent enzyme (double-stranded beta helix superfamily)
MVATISPGAARGRAHQTRHAAQQRALTLAHDLLQLDPVAARPAPLAMGEGALILAHLLANPVFLRDHVVPAAHHIATGGPYVARRYESERGGYALEIFMWPVGARTAIHDHSCWGLMGCAFGALQEERYTRLDSGAHPQQARLRRHWRRVWRPGAGISTLLPYEGGIHRVSNPCARPVLSVHVYGPSGPIDGRDYDPDCDYVCERVADDTPARLVIKC